MLYLLSPAKRLDYEARLPAATLRKATEPLFHVTPRGVVLITPEMLGQELHEFG